MGEGVDDRRSPVLNPRERSVSVRRERVNPSGRGSLPSYGRQTKVLTTKEETMSNRRGSGSLRNRELYEELRNEGASAERAFSIANAVENGGDQAVEGPDGDAAEH